MSDDELKDLREQTSDAFDLEKFLLARKKTKDALAQTANLIKSGMSEGEGIEILQKVLKDHGVEKYWHPTKFRIGSNTTKNFRDISDPLVLSDNDLFFIDIGPVFFNHEADYGETFIVGNNPDYLHLQQATRIVFDRTSEAFKLKKLTGVELYQFAEKEAEKLHLKLNSNMYGHRLGDFPHALYFKGDLGEFEKIPNAHLWVLEIHLLDERINRGAFYEDLLI